MSDHPCHASLSFPAIALAALLAVFAIAAAGASKKDDVEVEDPGFTEAYLTDAANIAVGEAIWAKQCRHCHGASAYPGKAPKLKPGKYKPDFVFKRVTKGFRKMPGWKAVYSFEERKAIVAYVLSSSFSP